MMKSARNERQTSTALIVLIYGSLLICSTSGVRLYEIYPEYKSEENYDDENYFNEDDLKKYIYPNKDDYTSKYVYDKEAEKNSGRDDYVKFDAELLESDYGKFEQPVTPSAVYLQHLIANDTFVTSNRSSRFETTKNNDAATALRDKIQQVVKRHLAKLYEKKLRETSTRRPPLIDDATVLQMAPSDNYIQGVATTDANRNQSKLLDGMTLLALKNKTKSYTNKLLSLFTIVTFKNDACAATKGATPYNGTCYHQSECDDLGGQGMGSCANGYGVCCVFKGTCGDTLKKNCSYFESPAYPDYYPEGGTTTILRPPPTGGSAPDPRLRRRHSQMAPRQATNNLLCVGQVALIGDNVRQLRIDFLDLELKGPTNGTCTDERFVVTGQNTNDLIPIICGYNTGQHVYVDVTDVKGPIQLSILSNNNERKRFKIRICQFTKCVNELNCLQYYEGVSGVITTFNYEMATFYPRSYPSYFNNLNYAICIRKEAGFCSITYTNVFNSTIYPFQLPNVDENRIPTLPSNQAGVETRNCPDDYLIINGVRLCGHRLNDGSTINNRYLDAPIKDSSGGPFLIPVRTNDDLVGRGFKIMYTQNLCANN